MPGLDTIGHCALIDRTMEDCESKKDGDEVAIIDYATIGKK